MATKYLKGECQQCGGHLEFPALSVVTVIDCPHCGKPTELLLPVVAVEPVVPRKAIIWTLVAVLILGLGLIGALVALKRAQKWAASRRPPGSQTTPSGATAASAGQGTNGEAQDPSGSSGFRASEVRLQKAAGTSLVYAVGTITNRAARQRFGVKVELDLLDAAGQKVGTAKDYQSVLEPKALWQFKALVVESKAAGARVSAIREDQ